MTEAQIQKMITNKLKRHGWFVTKIIQSSTNGIPDLLCIRKGHVVFIEVKTPNGVVSELQKHFIEILQQLGMVAFVARSVEDIDVLCYKNF